MDLYCTLLNYLNNHESTGDFNYVLNWINREESDESDDKLTSAVYCFLIAKTLYCKRLGVKLNRKNALLHIKNYCNDQTMIDYIDQSLIIQGVNEDTPIPILIMYYFLHIEEKVETHLHFIDVLFDAYHEKL